MFVICCIAVGDAPAFVVGHEEALVAAVIHLGNVDRTARHKTKLVLTQHRVSVGRCVGMKLVAVGNGLASKRVITIEPEEPIRAAS